MMTEAHNGIKGFKGAFILFAAVLALFAALVACNRISGEEQRLYDEAEKALAEGNFTGAIEKYSALVDGYPNSRLAPECQYKVGYVNGMHLRNAREAINAFAILFYVYPESEFIDRAHEDRAAVLSMAGDHRSAVEDLVFLIEHGPSEFRDRYRYKLALEYIKLDDYAQGRIELEDLLKYRPSTTYAPLAYQNIANAYFLEGKYAEAVKAYETVIERFPNDPVAKDAKIEKASSLVADRSLVEARSWLEKLEQEYPTDTVIKIKLYAVRERLKDETISIRYPDGSKKNDMTGVE